MGSIVSGDGPRGVPPYCPVRISFIQSAARGNILRSIGKLMIAAIALTWLGAASAASVDEDAAQSLAKKSGCLKCQAIDKKKDAPSYKEIAGKYKGKPDAEDKLFKHATTNPKVKIDGKEETHDSPKSKDEKEIRNLVRWVLTR